MGDVELRRFVRISLGSLSELESDLLLATELEFLKSEGSHLLIVEVRSIRGMLQNLHRALSSVPPERGLGGSRP
jgi:four helix bundle protein